MSVTAFIGDVGSGKTASAVREMLIKQRETGFHILTNMNLNPDYFDYTLITFQDVLEMGKKGEGLHNKILFFDEFHIFADSRTSMKNKVITHLLLLSRKLNIYLYYTTQYLNNIDLRIRNVTNVVVECHTQEHPETGVMLTLNKINNRKMNKIITANSIFETKNVFNLYDTNELIQI